MTIAIIGRGLIGSAAARHLAEAGQSVILIGPSEPQEKKTHDGVFGSHYDEGRITRGLDPDPFWSRVSRASIARYRDIEMRSGTAFFSEVGVLMAGPGESELVQQVGEVAQRDGIPSERLSAVEMAERFPYFSFPNDAQGFFETQNAGHISPRRLVKAQTKLARMAGAEVLDQTVTGLTETRDSVKINTPEEMLSVDRVLVAAGAFANMVLSKPLPVEVYARTVALFEVDEPEAQRLSAQPALIWLGRAGDDPYLLPPIRYPNGKTYLKLGGDPKNLPLNGLEAIQAWFRSGGSAEVEAHLDRRMRDLMPDLAIRSVHRDACVTTYSARNLPIIAPVSDRIHVAVAGCGRGAKCSDELGRLGADCVLSQSDAALTH